MEQTRRTRKIKRTVEVAENQCVVCKSWYEVPSGQTSYTCSTRCRVALHRSKKREAT
jgi:predicted nucleic acid-binding Zn ribbon protein